MYALPWASASSLVNARRALETQTEADAHGEHIHFIMPCSVNLLTMSVAAGHFRSFTGINFRYVWGSFTPYAVAESVFLAGARVGAPADIIRVSREQLRIVLDDLTVLLDQLRIICQDLTFILNFIFADKLVYHSGLIWAITG